VIVITHAYGQRTGVRYLTNGLKVYYLPGWVGYQQAVPPTFYSYAAIMRHIFIREQIEIIHGHQVIRI
jgi:phosphatidylinositol glycan class A protein